MQEKELEYARERESTLGAAKAQVAHQVQAALEAERSRYNKLKTDKDDMQFELEEQMARLKQQHAGTPLHGSAHATLTCCWHRLNQRSCLMQVNAPVQQ
jgi:hypothetical protein